MHTEAILEALIARSRTDEGTRNFSFHVRRHGGMDDGAASAWRGRDAVPVASGSRTSAIAPYGVFKTRDGADILIAIQNDREWRVLADKVLGDAALGTNAKFASD